MCSNTDKACYDFDDFVPLQSGGNSDCDHTIFFLVNCLVVANFEH